MEVVINGCFGGFGLSYKAIKAIMERKGMECHAYYFDWRNNVYRRCKNTARNFDFCFTRDFGDTIASGKINNLCGNETFYISSSFGGDEDRTDPDLVAVVKELGKEASSSAAELYVVEIPDDIPNGWYISNYDGMESVEENHRSWN